MIQKYNLYKTVCQHIKEKGKYQIEQKLMALFKQTHGHEDIKKVLKSRKLFDPLNVVCKNSQYAQFIGIWSECYVTKLKKNGIDRSDFFIDINKRNIKHIADLSKSENKAEATIAQSIQNYKNKTAYKHEWTDMSVCYDSGWPSDLLYKDTDFFKQVIIHFRDKVFPHTINFWNHNDFVDSEKFTSIYECDIQGWEFDFYDEKNNMIVDFKFQKKSFDSNWILQTVLYVYLMFYNHKIKCKGIKIINTLHGIEYWANLTDLFGKDGDTEFFKICRLSILDKEKQYFQIATYECYKQFYEMHVIADWMVKKIYLIQDILEIEKIHKFLKKLFEDKETNLLNLGDINWIWIRWMEWEKNYFSTNN